MNRKYLAGLAVALVIGLFVGRASSNKYMAGRLSACKDIAKNLNDHVPAPLQLDCVIQKGDVYITSPLFQEGKKMSLTGDKFI